MRACKKRSNRSNARFDVLLGDITAVRKRRRSTGIAAKDFGVPFRILTIYCNRLRETDVKSASPTLSLNTEYIQQI